MRAFVLDCNKTPLTPCRMARARILLKMGRAAVFRRYPFTIILKEPLPKAPVIRDHRVKIDPGSRTTGLAVVQEGVGKVVFAAELEHRGSLVKKKLELRRIVRRFRRQRKMRHRQPRFLNRTKPRGWLPPSLESRVSSILTWVGRFRRICSVRYISQEVVKFDTQMMENPEISGIEYQQGTLVGYEVREYLLEKWDRTCAYCGKKDVPLQIEHIHPRSTGGTDRISNLTLACGPCNQKKGNISVEKFLKNKPNLLVKIQLQVKDPLKDAAAVNTTRWALWRRLTATGLPVECGSGGRTKFNRTVQGYPKAHWIDAACVGESGGSVRLDVTQRFLVIKATGHGRRQMCQTDKYGFPNKHRPRASGFLGYKTGDMVRAVVPKGRYRGIYVGRVVIRYRPSFLVGGVDVNPRYLARIQWCDGYSYAHGGLK